MRQTDRQTETKTLVLVCLALGICALMVSGCGIFMMMSVEAKKEINITGKLTYEEAYQKAVKACDGAGLEFIKFMTTEDRIVCNDGAGPKAGYNLYVAPVKGQLRDDVVRVTVEVEGRGFFTPPNQSDADEMLGKYLDALKSMGVQ